MLRDGSVVYWPGNGHRLRVVRRSGAGAETVPLPPDRQIVSIRDREWWLNTAIPQEFMGQRVFEPIREKARTDVPFPGHFPPVLALLADPGGGVWVQRTGAGSGELWVWLEGGRERARIRLQPGREVVAMGREAFAARRTVAEGRFTVEVYRKP